jgi:prevent-host-death family protein
MIPKTIRERARLSMFNECQLKDFKAKVQHYVQQVRQTQLPLVIADGSEENVVLMDAGTLIKPILAASKANAPGHQRTAVVPGVTPIFS